MKLVQITEKLYNIPEEWNELSTRQVLKIIPVLNSKDIIHSAQLKLLKILTGISWWRIWLKDVVDMDDKLYLTNFLIENRSLTKNPFPKFKNLYGPADDFENLKVAEFCFADAYFKAFRMGDDGALDKLIASLWRPGKKNYNKKLNPDGDIREAFNDNVIEHRARHVKKIPKEIKSAMLLWYEGCHIKLMLQHPKIFSQSAGEGRESRNGMYTIIRYVAGKGIHGTLPNIENMYLSTFLMELEEIFADGERMKEAQAIQKLKNGL